MGKVTAQQERLKRLDEWATAYTGMTKGDLARALGRDRTRRIPEGEPTLGYLVRLADVLDLSVGDLVEFLKGDLETGPEAVNPADSFEQLEDRAKDAYRRGEYAEAIDVATQAYQQASRPELRARACNLQAGGYDGLGRYTKAMEAAQSGLRERPISADLRMQLRAGLASAYYTLGQYYEARSMATELIDGFDKNPPTSDRDLSAQAHAFYVRGHTLRCLIDQEPENARTNAALAKVDLERAANLYEKFAQDMGHTAYAGIANTCRGGMIEVDVELEILDPEAGVERILDGLPIEPDKDQGGDWLESYGWWCIFGCNIAQRHLQGTQRFLQVMGTLTGKANDIAGMTGNWALREQVWRKEYDRRECLEEVGAIPMSDWPIDDEDVHALLGVVSRFPRFRENGWKILQTGRFISRN